MLHRITGLWYTLSRTAADRLHHTGVLHLRIGSYADDRSIILGSRDIYEPFSHTVAADWKYDIIFSDGTHFQSFTPSSHRDEEWRLIDYKRDNHMILWDIDE